MMHQNMTLFVRMYLDVINLFCLYLEINFCLLISGHGGVCMPAIRLKFHSFNIYCYIYMHMLQTNGTTNEHKILNQSEYSVNTQTGRKTISISQTLHARDVCPFNCHNIRVLLFLYTVIVISISTPSILMI